MAVSYLVQEEDGTSRLTLEEGGGFLLLEESTVGPTPTALQGGIIVPRRRLITRLLQEGFEEDEAIALSLLLRTRKRLR